MYRISKMVKYMVVMRVAIVKYDINEMSVPSGSFNPLMFNSPPFREKTRGAGD